MCLVFQATVRLKLMLLGAFKIALRRAVSQGEFFPSDMPCVEYLCEKFSDHTDPEYIITEIYSESLPKARKNARYTK